MRTKPVTTGVHDLAVARRKASATDGRLQRTSEAGSSLIAALLVFSLLAALGYSLITTTGADYQVSGTYRDLAQARYLAEAGIQTVVGKQNDTALSPRYLFNQANYVAPGVNPAFPDLTINDPANGSPVGTVVRAMVGGKNPLLNPPPYRIRSTSSVRGTQRTIEADIAPLSLLEYALWTEASVSIAPYITYTGKVYSATSITLTAAPVTFHRKVEYVTNLIGGDYGTYLDGNVHLSAAKPSITTLVSLPFYLSASQTAGICDSGIGLRIAAGMAHENLFKRSTGIYQIDLTLFDFSGPYASPQTAVTYNGVQLMRYDVTPAAPLLNFNGIIYVEGELHVWGINGGRSSEDVSILDSTYNTISPYSGPDPANPNASTTGKNRYSNNQLDPTEDTNGNGILDPARKGRSLTIVSRSTSDIVIDHNIFMGVDPLGVPVRIALIAGKGLRIALNSPKTLVVRAALLARGVSNACATGYSWYPCGNHDQHMNNWWARRPDGTYVYDTDHDETIEANNGAVQTYDRDETSMNQSWSLQVLGNRIFAGAPSSGHWAGTDSHARYYSYDDTLVIYEPPCYPVLPEYDLVAGSVVELR